MVIPHVFDSLLGIKPKNPHIASLLSKEVGSQDIGINLTQFHSFVDKRVNHCSNRPQRATKGVKEVFHTSDQIDQVFNTLLQIQTRGVKMCSHIRN